MKVLLLRDPNPSLYDAVGDNPVKTAIGIPSEWDSDPGYWVHQLIERGLRHDCIIGVVDLVTNEMTLRLWHSDWFKGEPR